MRYDKRLSDFARLLYSDITALCNRQGYCSASNGYFAEVFGKSARTISATIASLAKCRYITIEMIRDDATNAVIGRKIWVQASAQAATEKVADPIEENFQYIKENITSINNNPLTPTGESELFDQFWAAYPKHVAKKPARRAWDKLHADADLLAKILAALEWQKREDSWQREAGRFIPNPATWLNARRWEDEKQAGKPPESKPRGSDYEQW